MSERRTQIYVAHLPPSWREEEVRVHFEQFGRLKAGREVCINESSGHIPRNAFLEYETNNGLQKAITAMDHAWLPDAKHHGQTVPFEVGKLTKAKAKYFWTRPQTDQPAPQASKVVQKCQSPPSGYWSCPQCTFHNPDIDGRPREFCEMCETARPGRPPSPLTQDQLPNASDWVRGKDPVQIVIPCPAAPQQRDPAAWQKAATQPWTVENGWTDKQPNVENQWNDKRVPNDRICIYFLRGKCSNKRCNFTHDIQLPCLYKTRLCRRIIEKGECPFGDQCSYAHDESELRGMYDPLLPLPPQGDRHSGSDENSPPAPPRGSEPAQSSNPDQFAYGGSRQPSKRRDAEYIKAQLDDGTDSRETELTRLGLPEGQIRLGLQNCRGQSAEAVAGWIFNQNWQGTPWHSAILPSREHAGTGAVETCEEECLLRFSRYSNILVLAEADFSLSYSLSNFVRSEARMWATSHESKNSTNQCHPHSEPMLDRLKCSPNVTVKHGVNARHIEKSFGQLKFDLITFTFGHTGIPDNKTNAKLMQDFFASARRSLTPDGEIFLTLYGQQFDYWKVGEQASLNGFVMKEMNNFHENLLPALANCGYVPSKGYRNQMFVVNPSHFYVYQQLDTLAKPERPRGPTNEAVEHQYGYVRVAFYPRYMIWQAKSMDEKVLSKEFQTRRDAEEALRAHVLREQAEAQAELERVSVRSPQRRRHGGPREKGRPRWPEQDRPESPQHWPEQANAGFQQAGQMLPHRPPPPRVQPDGVRSVLLYTDMRPRPQNGVEIAVENEMSYVDRLAMDYPLAVVGKAQSFSDVSTDTSSSEDVKVNVRPEDEGTVPMALLEAGTVPCTVRALLEAGADVDEDHRNQSQDPRVEPEAPPPHPGQPLSSPSPPKPEPVRVRACPEWSHSKPGALGPELPPLPMSTGSPIRFDGSLSPPEPPAPDPIEPPAPDPIESPKLNPPSVSGGTSDPQPSKDTEPQAGSWENSCPQSQASCVRTTPELSDGIYPVDPNAVPECPQTGWRPLGGPNQLNIWGIPSTAHGQGAGLCDQFSTLFTPRVFLPDRLIKNDHQAAQWPQEERRAGFPGSRTPSPTLPIPSCSRFMNLPPVPGPVAVRAGPALSRTMYSGP